MASTNFKLFDENKTNMMSDTEYNINTQRLNGVQAGIASSQLQNKTLYQTSLVAYSLAQIMMQNGYDANDSAAVSAFVGNMSNSLLQKVIDKATEEEAKAGINNSKWLTPFLVKSFISDYMEKRNELVKICSGKFEFNKPDDGGNTDNVLTKEFTIISVPDYSKSFIVKININSLSINTARPNYPPITYECKFSICGLYFSFYPGNGITIENKMSTGSVNSNKFILENSSLVNACGDPLIGKINVAQFVYGYYVKGSFDIDVNVYQKKY